MVGKLDNIVKNLEDCGCNKKQISEFLHYTNENDVNRQISLLKCQRCDILQDLHTIQQKVDRLDYLINKLKLEK